MPLEIALLEDDDILAQLVKLWLSNEGLSCRIFSTGQELLNAVINAHFDLFLIDWELPDINGPDVTQILRMDLNINTPIIFVTSRDTEEDIVSALNLGADDYLVKPIRQFEFIARIQANTRRKKAISSSQTSVEFPPYIFNLNTQQVSLHENIINLSGKEFELSYYLFCNIGKLLSRKQILKSVWKQQADLNTRTVDTHMSIIRKKLDLSPKYGWRLKSIYGHGYRLESLNA